VYAAIHIFVDVIDGLVSEVLHAIETIVSNMTVGKYMSIEANVFEYFSL